VVDLAADLVPTWAHAVLERLILHLRSNAAGDNTTIAPLVEALRVSSPRPCAIFTGGSCTDLAGIASSRPVLPELSMRVTNLAATLFLSTLALPQETDPGSFPRSTVPLADGLRFADNLTIAAPHNFLRGHGARSAGGLVNAVVEIPAGACEKWEVKPDGVLRWDMKDGKPRHVKYLGYPCNYGMIPRTLLGEELGGDGDPLDVLVLGPAVPRGTVLGVRLIGLIRLVDDGEKDDKLIAVTAGSPLAQASSVLELDQLFPGITAILELWFENYKGKDALQCGGFAGPEEAERLLQAAIASFDSYEQAAAAGQR
jgi:inorganic pyrophosphatase